MMIADLVQLCDDALAEHANATPGPWKWWTSNSYRRLSSPNGDGDVLHGYRDPRDGVVDIVGNEYDKAFIANARVREPVLAESLRELLKALETCFDNNGLSADGFIEILESNKRLRTKLGEACDLAAKLIGDKDDPRIAELRQEATKR